MPDQPGAKAEEDQCQPIVGQSVCCDEGAQRVLNPSIESPSDELPEPMLKKACRDNGKAKDSLNGRRHEISPSGTLTPSGGFAERMFWKVAVIAPISNRATLLRAAPFCGVCAIIPRSTTVALRRSCRAASVFCGVRLNRGMAVTPTRRA